MAWLQGMICVCSAENVGVGGLFIQEKEGFPPGPLSKKAVFAVRPSKGGAGGVAGLRGMICVCSAENVTFGGFFYSTILLVM